MAVYKALRTESAVQFVETARKLAICTRKNCIKINFKLTATGKVLKRMTKESVRAMKRKLEKFKKWNENGREVVINGERITKKFTLADACAAYASWRSHMLKGDNYYRVKRMDERFRKLFGVNPANKKEWKEVFACTELETQLRVHC